MTHMAAETQYKILILEDRPEDCELVQRVLSQEGIAFVMHRADTEKDMLKELRHFKPDIIISDYVMPGFNALKALDIVLKAAPETPFIVVSGTVGEETAADAIRSGASDYVMKDNLKRLGPAIRRELDKIERRRRTQQVESDLRKRLQNAEQMETLGKMAGKVAHDLNNIIGPLVAYPDLILDQLPPESPVRDDILEIRKAAEHAAEMIKDLLTLARRGNFHAVSVDLNVVVKEYTKSLGLNMLLARHPEQKLECQLAENLPHIMGSAPHLQAVLMNLVINAIDAGKPKPVLISTKAVNLEHPLMGYEKIPAGHYVVLSVADKGHGIEPADMKRLFEPFFSRKQMGSSGTGLGLAIIYGILKDHQGYIDIRSEVGIGTEFLLYFAAAPEVTHAAVPAELPSYEGEETVLIVDDLQPQLDLGQALLNSLGYHVLTATNEYQAMNILDENTVQLVLLDMNMGGGGNGLHLFERILEKVPDLPCIFVSGSADQPAIAEARKMGCSAFVQKPFSRPVLGRAVREELDRHMA